jgi:hypothetical protein
MLARPWLVNRRKNENSGIRVPPCCGKVPLTAPPGRSDGCGGSRWQHVDEEPSDEVWRRRAATFAARSRRKPGQSATIDRAAGGSPAPFPYGGADLVLWKRLADVVSRLASSFLTAHQTKSVRYSPLRLTASMRASVPAGKRATMSSAQRRFRPTEPRCFERRTADLSNHRLHIVRCHWQCRYDSEVAHRLEGISMPQ